MKEAASIVDKPRRRKIHTIKGEHGTTSYPTPLFIVILPAYKEEMETMEATLRVLASHSQARRAYHVCPYIRAQANGNCCKGKTY